MFDLTKIYQNGGPISPQVFFPCIKKIHFKEIIFAESFIAHHSLSSADLLGTSKIFWKQMILASWTLYLIDWFQNEYTFFVEWRWWIGSVLVMKYIMVFIDVPVLWDQIGLSESIEISLMISNNLSRFKNNIF